MTDAGTRKLLGDLAEAELGHQDRAAKVEAERLPSDAAHERMQARESGLCCRSFNPGWLA